MNPWVTKEVAKSSGKKQNSHEKYLQKRTPKDENIKKSFKSLFDLLKRNLKSSIILKNY